MHPKSLLLTILVFALAAPFVRSQTIESWKDTYGKSPTQFSAEDWRQIIDQRWGSGMTTPSKLAFFDEWYELVDSLYAAFQGLDFDIEAFRSEYRTEIEQGVSRGRFAVIMNHFGYRLEDLHTFIADGGVASTDRSKGVPLLVVGQLGSNNGFGAVITPLPDSTLLVYDVLSNHPLDLVQGDVVLGYDGVLWKDIYPKLLDAQLPLFLNSRNASDDESNAYYLLSAAGLNWHLFDTIDVLQYSTGDTLRFDTRLLANERRTIWAREGLEIPGVAWPNRAVDRVSFGVVDSTNVGYVYVTSWSFNTPGGIAFDIRQQFREAIVNLWFTEGVDALILDFRFNTGGGALAIDGWSLLFNEVTPTIGYDERADPNDHFAMREDPLRRATNLVIRPDQTTYWDKPIAVLMGPNSISAGELESLRASFHPRTRLFGLPAPGGNTGSIFPTLSRPEWSASLATSNMFLVEDHSYLAHVGLEPDERVWLDRDDVANGEDTVVKAALDWIQREIISVGIDGIPSSMDPTPIGTYPNPFHSGVTVEVEVEHPQEVEITVSDILGRRISVLRTDALVPGIARLKWDGTATDGHNAPAGVYLLMLKAGDLVYTTTVVKSR